MKCLLPLLLSLLSFLSTARADGLHFSVAFSATLTTSVITGSTSAVFKVTKINNATIFNQLAKSGSFAGVTAADMAIVLNFESGNDLLDVINKNTHAILLPLVVSGSDEALSGVVGAGNNSKATLLIDSEELINLPDGSQVPTNALLRAVQGSAIPNGLAFFSFSFVGATDGALLQGTVRKQTKVYIY